MSKKQVSKKQMIKRIGANRQKQMEEQRAQRPRVMASAAKRGLLIAAALALVAAAGCAVYAYGPAGLDRISETVKSGKRLGANVRITNCGKRTQALVRSVVDSLLTNDSIPSFDRAEFLNAVAAIPEIEKVGIKKVGRRGNRAALVKVTERKPVALVHGGDFFLVDKNGVRFAANPGQYYDLPLLIINAGGQRDTIDMGIFNTIKEASRSMGGAFFQQISQIDVSDRESVNLFFKSGEAEYLVGCDDMGRRLAYVKKLRERLLEVQGEPARIDLRYRCLAFASAR